MPDSYSYDTAPEIQRTASGGFTFFRRRSAQEKEEISRSRAQELSILYEMSDVKAEELNKKANIKHRITNAPSLSGGMMNLQQAAALAKENSYNQSAAEARKAQTDPLLTKHERMEKTDPHLAKEERKLQKKLEELERRKDLLEAYITPAGEMLTRGSFEEVEKPNTTKPPTVVKNSATTTSSSFRTEKDLRIDADLPEEMGMEVSLTDTPSTVSVEETVAMTPSPVYGNIYQASNGRTYWAKNLC